MARANPPAAAQVRSGRRTVSVRLTRGRTTDMVITGGTSPSSLDLKRPGGAGTTVTKTGIAKRTTVREADKWF